MAEKITQQTTERTFVNPFCRPYVPGKPIGDSDGKYIYRIGKVTVNPETLVVEVEYDKVDSQQEVEACKSLCGVDLMKAKLKAGLVSPEDFYDDGKSGVDTTQIPTDVHTMRRFADMQSDQLAALAKKIGIKVGESVTPQQFEDALIRYIKDNPGEFVQQSESEVK